MLGAFACYAHVPDKQNGFYMCMWEIMFILLFSLTTVIRNRISSNLDTFVCFIDLSKASDLINLDLLLLNLLQIGICSKTYFITKEPLSYFLVLD